MAEYPKWWLMVWKLFILGLLRPGWSVLMHPSEDYKEFDEVPIYQPEQTHLTYDDESNGFTLTWSTPKTPGKAKLKYGEQPKDQCSVLRPKILPVGGSGKKQWVNIVKLNSFNNNTAYNTTYVYKIGSNHAWSELMKFRTPPPRKYQPQRVLYFGDIEGKGQYNMTHMSVQTRKGKTKQKKKQKHS
ncbi:acid phosphatase type 7-like [Pectinophora gossypiella]|uniref:acid phosphatase type 7-like n=1 Tax=Pectinophora gossypiella TaxID=13191 RepID=UPI00214F00A9|nr:acid phosphatase type 7-like [Pectinophora gossypiella]